MKKMSLTSLFLRAALLALTLTLLCGTALAALDADVLGTWVDANGKYKMVIHPSGTVAITVNETETTYDWTGEGRRMTINNAEQTAVVYNGFTMRATPLDGEKVTFRRESGEVGATTLTGIWSCKEGNKESRMLVLEDGTAILSMNGSMFYFVWERPEATPETVIFRQEGGDFRTEATYDGKTVLLPIGGSEMTFNFIQSLTSFPGTWTGVYVETYITEDDKTIETEYQIKLVVNKDNTYTYSIGQIQNSGTWDIGNGYLQLKPERGEKSVLFFDGQFLYVDMGFGQVAVLTKQ